MPNRPENARVRRGFTLVELLIVIGIIGLLMALLVPTVTSSLRKARRTRVQLELNGIATALDAYKSDFGDYPRFGLDPADPLNNAGDRGARLLARALMGPAPAAGIANVDPYFGDGFGAPEADTFGFKDQRQAVTRGGTTAFTFPGPVRGPYLDAEKFRLKKSIDTNVTGAGLLYGPDATLLDPQFESSILYYPARFKSPALSNGGLFVGPSAGGVPQAALFNSFDNEGQLPMLKPTGPNADPEERGLALLLGDVNENGLLDVGETAASTGPFLLIAKGSEGEYGDAPVANFTPSTAKKVP